MAWCYITPGYPGGRHKHPWDSFVHVPWDDLDIIVEDVRSRGGVIAIEGFDILDAYWDFRNAHLADPDGYQYVLGGMRERQPKPGEPGYRAAAVRKMLLKQATKEAIAAEYGIEPEELQVWTTR